MAAVETPEPSKLGAQPKDLSPSSSLSINWDALSKDDAELYQSLQAVVESLGDEATADHPIVEARDKLATAFRDKAALLKRNWTDEMFQEGEEMNEEKVAEIEEAMATDLGRSGGGLRNGQNLGNALDLVGVYMKNYKLDKADAVLSRCGPFVSERGGVWMIKWLNHVSASVGLYENMKGKRKKIVLANALNILKILRSNTSWNIFKKLIFVPNHQVSTVRMKQSRHLEALAAQWHQ